MQDCSRKGVNDLMKTTWYEVSIVFKRNVIQWPNYAYRFYLVNNYAPEHLGVLVRLSGWSVDKIYHVPSIHTFHCSLLNQCARSQAIASEWQLLWQTGGIGGFFLSNQCLGCQSYPMHMVTYIHAYILGMRSTNKRRLCNIWQSPYQKWPLHGHTCIQRHRNSRNYVKIVIIPDSKVRGANFGPTWVLSAPDGLHVGLMNLAIVDTNAKLPNNIWCTCLIQTIQTKYWERVV